ncbi:MAG: glycoside hydrolase family protein [Planctomycetota bacterium]
MKNLRPRTWVFLLALSGLGATPLWAAETLIVYSRIPGRAPSDHYHCRVSLEGHGEFQEAFVLQTRSGPSDRKNGYFPNTSNWTASFVNVEFSGAPLLVEISRVSGEPVAKAKVRPEGKTTPAVVRGGKVYVTIDKPMNISVDIDGQMEDHYTGMGYKGGPVHNMLVFANPVMEDRPRLGAPGVHAVRPGSEAPRDGDWRTLYFLPGVHDIGQVFPVRAGQTIYIPGDAVVHGTIHTKSDRGKTRDIRICGYGALSGEKLPYTGRMDLPKHERAKGRPLNGSAAGSRFEGITFVDPSYHTFHVGGQDPEAPNVIDNIKILAWRANGDGINAFSHTRIRNCFIRTSDDSFYLGRDVHISDTVIWNDSNGASIRLSGAANQGDETSSFTNINVIYHRAYWHYWAGGRAISFRHAGPGATIRNVLVKNVVVEDPLPAFPPFYFTMDGKSTTKRRQVMENIIIQDVVQHHPAVEGHHDKKRGKPRNTMMGLNEDNPFSNITFRNCRYMGKVIRSFIDGDFKTNEFVRNIRFEDW